MWKEEKLAFERKIAEVQAEQQEREQNSRDLRTIVRELEAWMEQDINHFKPVPLHFPLS